MGIAMKRIIFIVLLMVWAIPSFAVTSNPDGSRTYSIPTDFVDINNVVWGVPAGVMVGDRLIGYQFSYNSTTGEYDYVFVGTDIITFPTFPSFPSQ